MARRSRYIGKWFVGGTASGRSNYCMRHTSHGIEYLKTKSGAKRVFTSRLRAHEVCYNFGHRRRRVSRRR